MIRCLIKPLIMRPFQMHEQHYPMLLATMLHSLSYACEYMKWWTKVWICWDWVSFAHWMHRKVYICVQKGEAFYQSNNWLLGHMYRKYKLSPPDCVGNKKWWFVFIYEFYVRRLSQNRDRLELNEIKFAEDYAATSTSTPVLTMIETELEKFIEEEVIELRILFSSDAWIISPHFTEVLKFDRLKGHQWLQGAHRWLAIEGPLGPLADQLAKTLCFRVC